MIENINLLEYKTLIFDCDGIILNSNKIKTQAFYNVTKKYGETKAEALLDYHVSNGGISRYKKFEYFIKTILQKDINQSELNTLLKEFAVDVKKALMSCEITKGLHELRKNTMHTNWIIVSGGDQEELREVFEARELSKLFDGGIFGSPDSKELILKREQKEGNIKEKALFLGDSKYDYKAAKTASIDFIFLSNWTEVKGWPTWTLNNKIPSLYNINSLQVNNCVIDTNQLQLFKGLDYKIEYYEQEKEELFKLEQFTTTNDVFLTKNENVFIFRGNLFPPEPKFIRYNGISKSRMLEIQPDLNNVINLDYENNKNHVLVSRKGDKNYFHWLIQTITSLIYLESISSIKDTVFLINQLSDWQRKIIKLFISDEIHLIELNPQNTYHVSELYTISLSSANASLSERQSWFKIDYFFLNLLRKKVFENTLISFQNIKSFDKIYISRSNSKRRTLENEKDIEEFLSLKGYKIIKPEELSFEEQVSIFKNAKIIIGPTGAALANLVFCSENCKVGIIQPTSLKHLCGGYATLASLVKTNVFVYTESSQKNIMSVKENYSISFDNFVKFIDLVEDNEVPKYKNLKFSLEFGSEVTNLKKFALKFEVDNDIEAALKMMNKALKLKPNGPLIKEKILLYKKILQKKEETI